jgi:hypothetical protein
LKRQAAARSSNVPVVTSRNSQSKKKYRYSSDLNRGCAGGDCGTESSDVIKRTFGGRRANMAEQ